MPKPQLAPASSSSSSALLGGEVLRLGKGLLLNEDVTSRCVAQLLSIYLGIAYFCVCFVTPRSVRNLRSRLLFSLFISPFSFLPFVS